MATEATCPKHIWSDGWWNLSEFCGVGIYVRHGFCPVCGAELLPDGTAGPAAAALAARLAAAEKDARRMDALEKAATKQSVSGKPCCGGEHSSLTCGDLSANDVWGLADALLGGRVNKPLGCAKCKFSEPNDNPHEEGDGLTLWCFARGEAVRPANTCFFETPRPAPWWKRLFRREVQE